MRKLPITPFKLAIKKPTGTPFQSLCRAIIFQQLSGTAATSILNKFIQISPKKKFPLPKDVLLYSDEAFARAGVSPQKRGYLRDLAKRFLDGTIVPRLFSKMSDQEIVDHLVVVKGVGVWTAQMFLIFYLRRPNVLPVGDLAIQKGFQKAFSLRSVPTEKKMRELARQYEGDHSALARYLWNLMDREKEKKRAKNKR